MTHKTVTIGSIVDIMPESGKSMKPIAQGIVKQVGGKWQSNHFKMSKKQVLVSVKKVLMNEESSIILVTTKI